MAYQSNTEIADDKKNLNIGDVSNLSSEGL